jgi:hypothetical protein
MILCRVCGNQNCTITNLYTIYDIYPLIEVTCPNNHQHIRPLQTEEECLQAQELFLKNYNERMQS